MHSSKTSYQSKPVPNVLLGKACVTINLELQINRPFLSLFHNVRLVCGPRAGCVCVLNHFSPCSAAPAAAFIFLHSQDHACTTKIYNGQNKNIFSSVIAGQTSVSLLDWTEYLLPGKSPLTRGAGGGWKYVTQMYSRFKCFAPPRLWLDLLWPQLLNIS